MGVGIYYGVPYKKSPPEESDKSKSDDKKYKVSDTEDNLEDDNIGTSQTTLKFTSS